MYVVIMTHFQNNREFKLENENGNEDATHDVSKRSPFSSSLRVIFSLSGVESGR